MSHDNSIRLSKSHPNLYKWMLVQTVFNLSIAAILLFDHAPYIISSLVLSQKQPIPLQLWGIIFLIIGCLLAYGSHLSLKNYRWCRRGLVLASYIGGVWAFGYWTLFFQNSVNLLNAPLLWSVYTINAIIWASEPVINPVSASTSEKADDNASR